MKNRVLTKQIGVFASVLFSLSSVLISGCGKKAEDPLIIVQNSDDEVVYDFINCSKDNVYLTTNMKCTYKKNGELEVYFPVSGKIVDKVYVKKGDQVKKGDVLAELSTGTLEQQIAELEYKIKRNELLLSYIDEEEKLNSQTIWINYAWGDFPMSEDARDESLEALEKSSDDKETGYNDTLEFDRLKLQKLRSELAQSRVYASFDGVVYSMAENLEGSTSNIDEVIMTIVDDAEGYFESDLMEYAQYFSEGTTAELNITYGSASGTYEVIPDGIDNWTDTMRFVVYSGDGISKCEAGTMANIKLVLEKRENVLALPYGCVHMADDEYYVYVVNEQGIREVKWVEVGLIGNDMIEIVGGLEEGEKVIRR